MKTNPDLLFAGALSVAAGWIDAAGYLRYAHLFLSFMSGNSTTVGIDAGLGRWSAIAAPALAILAFVIGSSLGTLIENFAGPRRVPVLLAVEAMLLGLAVVWSGKWFGSGDAPAFAWFPIPVAMGAHNATLRHVGPLNVGLTYVTGTLAKLGQCLVEAFLGRARHADWMSYALMWGCLTAGAAAGTAAGRAFGLDTALLLAATALLLLSLAGARRA